MRWSQELCPTTRVGWGRFEPCFPFMRPHSQSVHRFCGIWPNPKGRSPLALRESLFCNDGHASSFVLQRLRPLLTPFHSWANAGLVHSRHSRTVLESGTSNPPPGVADGPRCGRRESGHDSEHCPGTLFQPLKRPSWAVAWVIAGLSSSGIVWPSGTPQGVQPGGDEFLRTSRL